MDARKEGQVQGTSLQTLAGVGPKTEKSLVSAGIETAEDLLYVLPSRYEDRREIRPISDVGDGGYSVVLGRVMKARPVFLRSTGKRAWEVLVGDGTGQLTLRWFHWTAPFVRRFSAKDTLLLVAGQAGRFGATLQMVHPDVTVLPAQEEAERHSAVIPVYPEIGGIPQGHLRRIIRSAVLDGTGCPESPLDSTIGRRAGIMTLGEAFRGLHLPDDLPEGDGWRRALEERLILEEYFLFQCALRLRREERAARHSHPLRPGPLYRRLRSSLPFTLTGGQRSVVDEIVGDLEGSRPMNRLLQGDVGSGKTVCAILAASLAADNNCQAAIMAPTEILAEQHYRTVRELLGAVGVGTALLRGDIGESRRKVLHGLRSGEIPVVVGTQALLEPDVTFRRLGLVVIDEQHRFGVQQRRILGEKATDDGPSSEAGAIPHVLVMTATPIPRTLSMVVYGDLDVSLLHGMPSGRTPVRTRVTGEKDRERIFAMVRAELDRGGQGYVVCPLVEESPRLDLLSARRMVEDLRRGELSGYRVGLIHGRMAAEEKEAIMRSFEARAVDVLVSTTVIEVGIDIPNATFIVVEHADRFGLSQLHQLRGRVGRGAGQSSCYLVCSDGAGAAARQRLRVLEKTADGFVVAEEDMRFRGPGELLGVRQAGLPRFRAGDITRDGPIMARARDLAGEAVRTMSGEARRQLEKKALHRFGSGLGLGHIA